MESEERSDDNLDTSSRSFESEGSASPENDASNSSHESAKPLNPQEAWIERRQRLLKQSAKYQERLAKQQEAYERSLEEQERVKQQRERVLLSQAREREQEARMRETLKREREYSKGLQAVLQAKRAEEAAKRAEEQRLAIQAARELKQKQKQQEMEKKRELIKHAQHVKLIQKMEEQKWTTKNSTTTTSHDQQDSESRDLSSTHGHKHGELQFQDKEAGHSWEGVSGESNDSYFNSYGNEYDAASDHVHSGEDPAVLLREGSDKEDEAETRSGKGEDLNKKPRKPRKLLPRWLKKKSNDAEESKTSDSYLNGKMIELDQSNSSDNLVIPLNEQFSMEELIRRTTLSLSAAMGKHIAAAATASIAASSTSARPSQRRSNTHVPEDKDQGEGGATGQDGTSVHIFNFAELMSSRGRWMSGRQMSHKDESSPTKVT